MVDVARLAGVSHQTVSRAINNPDSVRPDTLAKVRGAIAELGYRPNLAARALVTSSTRTLGVVTAASSFYGPAATTSALEEAARTAGYACLVVTLSEQGSQEVGTVLDFLVARGVDGIIAVAPQDWVADAAARAASTVPLVVVADGMEPSQRIHVVSVDQELGARMAVRHLVSRGRRTIAHVSGAANWFDARARIRGWRGALEDSGLAPGALVDGDWSAQSGYEAASLLLARQAPDAVFCGNDLMALGLLAAARDQGVDVPGDLAVVGYDDIAGAGYFAPALTTVRQPFAELGRLCLDVLLAALDGAPGTTHSISPTLRVRQSSL